MYTMPPKPGGVSSRYTGVSSTTGGTTWRAQLRIGKSFPEQAWQRYGLKTCHLGVFDDEDAAAHARDR